MEMLKKMLGCTGINRSNPTITGYSSRNIIESTSSLPAPLSKWPEGNGFASGKINLGQIEVVEIKTFDLIWGSNLSKDKKKDVSFYKPVGIPEQFFSLGHYCQPNNNTPLDGSVLVAKDLMNYNNNDSEPKLSAALQPPLGYSLVWNSGQDTSAYDQSGYFWLPQAPPGYKALGFVVTNHPEKPDLTDVRCVREDLVDDCEAYKLLIETHSKAQNTTFKVWKTRPSNRGMLQRGVSMGTFFCATSTAEEDMMTTSCLKNLDRDLNAMPNLDQIHALMQNYGPTVFFHPKEIYFPSSVSWFFQNEALLYTAGQSKGLPVDAEGTNLPSGGGNDSQFWLDLPDDNTREVVKQGNLESAELYVHVKPAFGGTCTDLAMWIFYPFNGPASLKIVSGGIGLGRTGEHVGDWEHFTLRVSNFDGRLDSIYFSEHSGGVWMHASELEFVQGNKAAVYSSKSGHASYHDAGSHLQAVSSLLNVGLINDCKRSNFIVDSSTKYQIVAAEYLGQTVTEPNWLQFMRRWGPDVVYDSKVANSKLRNIADKLPKEIFRQEGPTGPKEKNNWSGDERW